MSSGYVSGGPGSAEPRVVLVTAPDRAVAAQLARELVDRRLAACVQLVSGVESCYRWQGEVQLEPEVLLLIKATSTSLPAIETFLAAAHPYDLPECVALEPAAVEAGYLGWWLESCSPPQAGTEPS